MTSASDSPETRVTIPQLIEAIRDAEAELARVEASALGRGRPDPEVAVAASAVVQARAALRFALQQARTR